MDRSQLALIVSLVLLVTASGCVSPEGQTETPEDATDAVPDNTEPESTTDSENQEQNSGNPSLSNSDGFEGVTP